MRQNQNNKHVPVLLGEVLKYLSPQKGESYLDLTAGYGGHAKAVLERTSAPNKAVLVDRDKQAANTLSKIFAGSGAKIVNQDFLTASENLLASGKNFDIILADLGVSSPHLNIASRGFSIRHDGPLDMRMDQRQSLTAEQVVNTYSETDLSRLIFDYGEERKANIVAKAIIAARPIVTTHQLANIVANTLGKHPSVKIHPATRTFQALRIAVNNELDLLKLSLPLWIKLLTPGGRLGVISFHSLEDRIVKQIMASYGGNRYDSEIELITKRPITGNNSEIVFNPRARSAKLRVAVKINNKKGETKHNAYTGKKPLPSL